MSQKYIDLDTKFITGGGGSTTFSGDLSGTSAGPQTVIGIQGRPFSATAPTLNQVPQWNGTSWVPATVAGGSAAPNSASYLTLGLDAGLTSERVLTAGTNVSFTDGGAGSTLTINAASPPNATTGVAGLIQLAGDLGGTYTSPSVLKINGVTVSGTPTSGQVPIASSGTDAAWGTLSIPTVNDATTGAKGIVQLAGDIGGTATSVTVLGLRGVGVSATAPTNNQVLQYNGTVWIPASIAAGAPQSATYLTVSLDGTLTNERSLAAGTNISFTDGGAGSTFTINNTYALPDSTSGVTGGIRLTADLGGTATSPSVVRVNGATYPAAGALVTGTVPRVTGTSAVAYGALDLANANAVTGVLPAANHPDATTGAKGIVQLAGDLGGTSTAPSVLKINGVTVSGAAVAGYVITAASPSTAAWTTLPSATSSVLGLVQLNTDLAGTATAPTVVAATGASGIFNVKCAATRNASTSKIVVVDTVLPQVATTNATLTTLYTFALTNNAINKINVEVTALRDNGDQGATYDLSCTVRADTGVYQLIGSVSKFELEDNPAWDATLAISGSNLLVQVTGVSAVNIGWQGNFHSVVTTY